MYRYIKLSTQEYPDTFEVGDKITIPLEGIGFKVVTCVQISGRRNNQYLFVFDSTVGNSSMTNMDTSLDNLYEKFPKNLLHRLRQIRLLQASEVFSNCDEPEHWDKLVEWGAEMRNPQINYFKSAKHRISENHNWWWLDDYLPKISEDCLSTAYSIINGIGGVDFTYASYSSNVRPAFIIS